MKFVRFRWLCWKKTSFSTGFFCFCSGHHFDIIFCLLLVLQFSFWLLRLFFLIISSKKCVAFCVFGARGECRKGGDFRYYDDFCCCFFSFDLPLSVLPSCWFLVYNDYIFRVVGTIIMRVAHCYCFCCGRCYTCRCNIPNNNNVRNMGGILSIHAWFVNVVRLFLVARMKQSLRLLRWWCVCVCLCVCCVRVLCACLIGKDYYYCDNTSYTVVLFPRVLLHTLFV